MKNKTETKMKKIKFPFQEPITDDHAVTETKSAAHLHFDLSGAAGLSEPHPFKLNFTPGIKIKDATNPSGECSRFMYKMRRNWFIKDSGSTRFLMLTMFKTWLKL